MKAAHRMIRIAMGNSGHERFIRDLADLSNQIAVTIPRIQHQCFFLAKDHINIDGFRFPDTIQVLM